MTCLGGDLPGAPSETSMATGGTGLPVLPRTPSSINTRRTAAPLRVASTNLLAAQGLAWLSTPLWRAQNTAGPAALASATARAALIPLRPVAPEAVRKFAWAPRARLQLAELQTTTVSPIARVLQDPSSSPVLSRTARRRALTPRGPLAHNTVTPVAGAPVAAPRLREIGGAGPAAMAGVPDDLPNPLLLATGATLVALVPSAPCGDMAIQDEAALLHLLQGIVAWAPTAGRVLDPAAPVPLKALGTCTPVLPRTEFAGRGIPAAESGVAHRQLLQRTAAWSAPAGCRLQHLPCPPAQATEATPGTITP
mmetsp:Transcript_104449/g.311888  ORF Transcript_104449/g.311888 Transcript_104449/m.311888 type:complete len:309 (+) Transcript_104449:1029-1955(+)